MRVQLKKELDNEFEPKAIKVELEGVPRKLTKQSGDVRKDHLEKNLKALLFLRMKI